MIETSRQRGDYSKEMCNDSLRLAPAIAIWTVKAGELGPFAAAIEVVAKAVRRLLAAWFKKGAIRWPPKRSGARMPESGEKQEWRD